jgi:hypothetical protein
MEYSIDPNETMCLTSQRFGKKAIDREINERRARDFRELRPEMTEKELRPLVIEDKNGDMFSVIGDGKSKDYAYKVSRQYPHSAIQVDLAKSMDIILFLIGKVVEPIWIEVNDTPLQVTPETFKDF